MILWYYWYFEILILFLVVGDILILLRFWDFYSEVCVQHYWYFDIIEILIFSNWSWSLVIFWYYWDFDSEVCVCHYWYFDITDILRLVSISGGSPQTPFLLCFRLTGNVYGCFENIVRTMVIEICHYHIFNVENPLSDGYCY